MRGWANAGLLAASLIGAGTFSSILRMGELSKPGTRGAEPLLAIFVRPPGEGIGEGHIANREALHGTDPVDFDRDVRPILEKSCWACHGAEKHKGGLRLDSREDALKGGKSGPAAVVGKAKESLLVQLVSGEDPDRIMPDEGPRLSGEQIGVLTRWIEEGMVWGAAAKPVKKKYELGLRRVAVPSGMTNPVDALVDVYFREHSLTPAKPIDDATYARRVFLDVVGMLPTPGELDAFVVDPQADKRQRLNRRLLSDNRRYAEHWLTFWNDALRNDYAGTGYIDGGRSQITQWLFDALYTSMAFDRFATELVSPSGDASKGFSKGIIWRGVVNASQVPPMQAAQNISQVFLGLNLKCASCHDSFINDWKLADAYSFAAVYAEGPLEVNRCDSPTGTVAHAGFLYPELGQLDAGAPREVRLKQLAALLVKQENGRFTRTIVNRLWARLMGRGLIEPTDEMDNDPWSAELLDYLAGDLAEHGYDLKRTLELILTSRAYQLPSTHGKLDPAAAFEGPLVRRMTAEQFVDAVRSVAGVWPDKADAKIRVPGAEGDTYPGTIRAALQVADPLMMALGRPNREQVVTARQDAATTLQAIELTNGAVLDRLLRQGARRWTAEYPADGGALVEAVYKRAVGRVPTEREREVAAELVGKEPRMDGVQDLLWVLTMSPEFQLIR